MQFDPLATKPNTPFPWKKVLDSSQWVVGFYLFFEEIDSLSTAAKLCREDLVIATKAGCTFDHDGLHICGSRPYIFKACDESLRRLNVSYIDLYYLHRVDPTTPFTESILAMKELVNQGKIKTIGLSEVSKEQMRGCA